MNFAHPVSRQMRALSPCPANGPAKPPHSRAMNSCKSKLNENQHLVLLRNPLHLSRNDGFPLRTRKESCIRIIGYAIRTSIVHEEGWIV